MLIIIRSNIVEEAKFEIGDRLVAANVIENELGDSTIEYVVDRKIKSYVVKVLNQNKFIALSKGKPKYVDRVDDAKFFKEYKKAKLFSDGLTNKNIDIIEVID